MLLRVGSCGRFHQIHCRGSSVASMNAVKCSLSPIAVNCVKLSKRSLAAIQLAFSETCYGDVFARPDVPACSLEHCWQHSPGGMLATRRHETGPSAVTTVTRVF